MIQEEYIDTAVEALIISSPEPLPARKISGVLDGVTPSRVSKAVAELNSRYATGSSSFRIRELAGGFQFYVLSDYVGYVEELFSRRRKLRLTRAALETLAIVAYRQPVTKTEIEHIRGVASDGVVRSLLEKDLLCVRGRAETIGKPLQYGSTDEFLKFFGLARLEDLPSMKEIEEMISSIDAQDQTELELQISGDGEGVKLNVADGTFDPEQRESLSEDYEEATEGQEIVAESDGILVLKRPAETEIDQAEETTGTDTETLPNRMVEQGVTNETTGDN